jgi:hypothetical protein
MNEKMNSFFVEILNVDFFIRYRHHLTKRPGYRGNPVEKGNSNPFPAGSGLQFPGYSR